MTSQVKLQDVKQSMITEEVRQSASFKEAQMLIDDFLEAPEWKKAFIIQGMASSTKLSVSTKTEVTGWFVKLVGSQAEYNRLKALQVFMTIKVPLPEPSTEFPSAPATEPYSASIGPFVVPPK